MKIIGKRDKRQKIIQKIKELCKDSRKYKCCSLIKKKKPNRLFLSKTDKNRKVQSNKKEYVAMCTVGYRNTRKIL